MLYQIISFEIRRALKKPAIYIYWGILFVLGFFIMNAAGGAFESVNFSISGDNVKVNSPGVLNIIFGVFSYVGIFIVAAITGSIVIKDFRYDTLSLTFTTQLKRRDYLWGRYIAAFLLSVMVFTGAGIGIYTGTIMPYLNRELFTEFMWGAYLNPYYARIIPNIFFISAIFFSLTILLRNIAVNWLTILSMYILYIVGQNMMRDIDNRTLAAMLDPFGVLASVVVSVGNTANDMNEKTVSLEDVYLYNRLLWIGIGMLFIFLTFMRFKFSFALKNIRLFRKKRENKEDETGEDLKELELIKPEWESSSKYNFMASIKTMFHSFKFEFKYLIKNRYFVLLSVLSVIFMYIASKAIGKMYDTQTYPVTYQVIGILKGSLSMFLIITIILFSGEMTWRERASKIHENIFTLPLNKFTLWIPKFIALSLAIAIMFGFMIICGVLFQLKSGYSNIELKQYFISIYGLEYVKYLLFAVLAFFVHSLINNKYTAYVALITYMVVHSMISPQFLQHKLFIFSSAPGWAYSDMAGFDFTIKPYLIFMMYWVLFAVLMTVTTNLIFVSGSETNIKARVKRFKYSLTSGVKRSYAIVSLLFLLTGSYIFYNTNILNDFKRQYTYEKESVEFERKYKKYEDIVQPKITDVNLHVEIYSEEGDLEVEGRYIVKNRSNTPIHKLHINSNRNITSLDIGWPNKPESIDNDFYYNVYNLEKPMNPGDSATINFKYSDRMTGFSNGGSTNAVFKNGTMFHNTGFPTFGYNRNSEISRNKIRRKHDLPDRELELMRDDINGISQNFITKDSDFISFEATIGTSSDQTALAPGDLIKEEVKNSRRYFTYRMPQKMINYYAILSARYETVSEKWYSHDSSKVVDVTVYHHKGHEFNLKNMISGVHKSLDFYTKNISDYPLNSMKIVEFPRFATFAQSFPGMIPFSEGIGFIADLRDLEKEDVDFDELIIDYPFYVTAHEMAHQWWAHQIIAANVEGSQMLMESVTQYFALKVMEEYYGKERMKKFLRTENYRYISSRKNDSFGERPLSKVAKNQSYIYYNKGSITLYRMDELLNGKLTPILSDFLKSYAYKPAPYPTTLDLMERIRSEVSVENIMLVDDMLNNITTYKHKTDSASYSRNEDLEYFTKASVEFYKFYSDDKGKRDTASTGDIVEVGLYNSKGKELELQKIRLKPGVNNLEIKSGRKPSKLVIDPYYKMPFINPHQRSVTIKKQKG